MAQTMWKVYVSGEFAGVEYFDRSFDRCRVIDSLVGQGYPTTVDARRVR